MSSSDLNGEGGYALCTAATAVHFIAQQPKGGGGPADEQAADGGAVFVGTPPAELTAIMVDAASSQERSAGRDCGESPSSIPTGIDAAEGAYDLPDGSQAK